MATLARLFLNTSLDAMPPVFVAYTPISVEPPVDGLAKSILSLGMGIVLLSRLMAVGIFCVRTLFVEVVVTTCFYCCVNGVSIFPFLSVLNLSLRF